MKALIVEDELISQCVLSKVLTERGHEATSYGTAEQAIVAWQKEFYPLAVIDAGLPGMNGLQLCRWIRSQPGGDRAYLIAAAHPKELTDPGDVLAAGANDFFLKPYDLGLLKVRLAIAEQQMREFVLRKEAEASLQQSQVDFQRLVETAREGLLTLTPEWRTCFASLQTAELLGWEAEEILERPIHNLIVETQHAELETLLEDQRRGEIRAELKFRRKDGSHCVALVSGTPTFGPGREFKGAFWMLTDLTEQLQLRTELATRQDDLEARATVLRATLAESEQALARQSQERDQLARELEAARETAQADLAALKTRAATLEQSLQVESDRRNTLSAELESARSQTRQTEAILTKAREDHERLSRQQQDQFSHLNETLQGERDERRRLADQLKRTELELESRTKQFHEEAARTDRNLQAEIGELKRTVESLRAVEQELTARNRVLSEDLARSREELANEAAARKRLEQELQGTRAEHAAQSQQRSADLQKAIQDLQALQTEHQRVSDELLQLREGLAKRSKDYMTEMVKASDELKTLIAERNRAEQALAETKSDLGAKLKAATDELARTREGRDEALRDRTQLEERLRKTGDTESRTRERVAELNRVREELKTAQEQAASTAENFKLESARRQQAEANLEKTRTELDRKLAELADQLERARLESGERARLATLASEESRSQAQALQALNDELKVQVETQQKLEARCAALANLARELSEGDQPADVARIIAGAAHRLLNWDAFSFELYSAEKDAIQPLLAIDTVNGRAAEVTPFHTGPQPTPMMRRILSSGPQLVLRNGPSSTHTDFLMFGDRARLSASLLYVAVRAGGRVLGFLSLQSYRTNAYTQQDLAIAEALGAQAGANLLYLQSAAPTPA